MSKRKNAEEDFITTPISVLSYIGELEAERDGLQAAKKACVDIYMDLHVSEMKGKPEHLKQAWSVGQEFFARG